MKKNIKKNRKVIHVSIPCFETSTSKQIEEIQKENESMYEAGGDDEYQLCWVQNMIQIEII